MGDKYQQMQDEMSRFEAEISGAEVMAHHIVSTGTYNSVQQRLEGMPFEHGLVPQPLIFPGIPPPPPPPPSLMVPPQVQRMRCHMEAPPMFLPPGLPGPQLPPPRPQPAVLSAAPKLYKQTKEIEEEVIIEIPELKKKLQAPPSPPPRPAPPPPPPAASDPPRPKKEKKNRKVVRTAGGQVWEDVSLLEWPDDDFRMFCGDLGNDVTDELLIRTFSKYSSFQRAKVIRDKRTNKSKGFGFVSFKEPADFIKAMKDMDGRYVGSRPIKLRKSSWKARSLDVVRKKEKEKAALLSQLLSGNKS